MLPLQQAYEVRSAVLEYIKATFHFKDNEVGKAFYQFIEDSRNGLFKGPYVSLKTPFVKAKEDEQIPLDIRPPFTPHLHQIQAFRRLTTHDGHQPEPTLLTTGTGSGKTECFLFPVLDYVYQMNREKVCPGVKVIILYPMNALASDQAKRLAEAIWGTEEDHPLRGKVTAGLFIGEGTNPKEHPTQMGKDHIIENRDSIVHGEVPDILLTNFKMLDYALMQQKYTPLWRGNLGVREPMLKFLVLDELHTYDGAQGTDVANLIRRLKLKLNLPEHQLTPIGTSATIGNKEDSKQLLCEYASSVFGEEFTAESIIEEHRISVEDFFADITEDGLPEKYDLKRCTLKETKTVEAYLRTIRQIWLPGCKADRAEIGARLRKLQIFKDLLSVTTQGIITMEQLGKQLGRKNAGFQRMLLNYPAYANIALENMLALISEAKMPGGKFPLLYLQVQLWQRELSGIQRFVQNEPEFTWRDSIPMDDRISLPIYFCRDCGNSGWITTKKATVRKFATDASAINTAFMDGDKDVILMNTENRKNEPIEDYINQNGVNETLYIHPDDLTIGAKTDPEVLRVRVLSRRIFAQNGKSLFLDKKCPLCMSDSLTIVGGRTTTLSSVGVSQIMASDMDSEDASKRKMLCFSNSVQDSAYLAGYYEIRTYRFLFRQSIQQYLKTIDKPVSLEELQEGFKKYWKARLEGDEYYYRFIPDDQIEKIDLKKNYRNHATGELTDKFKKEFDLRVDWEICSEFGMMSTRGRTLEKMGSSATLFRENDLRLVFQKMETWLNENHLDFICKEEPAFLHFANGILHRLRQRGGIDHEFLRLYRTQQLKPVMLNWPRQSNIHFLYRGFRSTRVPHMIGYQPVKTKEEVLDVTTVRNNRRNWFYNYFIKCLIPQDMMLQPNVEQINDFYVMLLNTMTDCMILDKKEAHGMVNYAIRPDAIYVEAGVRNLKCDECESHLFVGKSDTLSEGTHCLDFKCDKGIYEEGESMSDNYYRQVYDRESSPRIYAHEHTGLLDREVRERIEHEFKDHTDENGKPLQHAINVLTATSTLEMGIDIGDLNVVANTGIPPKPGNFLQRIGRAGRKEGSALVLNYAKAGKHDMFYFASPLEMMEGEVSTPGCFLEARDILRRHFLAYCIDSWVSADSNNEIPNVLRELHLNHILLTDPNFFINRIFEYIKGNLAQLEERFRKQYPQNTQPVLDELFITLDSTKFYEHVIVEFENLIERINQIRTEKTHIGKMLKEIPMNDTMRRTELLDQNRSLRAQEEMINKEIVVEFMTNAGLLPNYAFPETGVKLTATIFSKKALGDEAGNTPEPTTLELVRPASQGIRELAPDNKFYTQKLKLPINGLSLKDRADSVKMLRYCSDCDALATEDMQEYNLNTCPKCGSDSWHANKHKFLKFTAALSSCYRDKAAINDSKEEREEEFYKTMKHFRFDHNGAIHSYGLKKVGFGIEFCKDVTLTEVNYGSRKQLADQVTINKQQHISGLGFVTCRYCGKSTPVLYGTMDAKEMHHPYCNHKEIGYPADAAHADTFDSLYLYRSMHTEAIKVLLPVQLFETEASSQLFKAGIELGMRHYYKSNPEHLRIDTYQEYNKATQNFDNYLVIYDTIPGGTGYLSKLYNKVEFSKLIEISYEHIRNCECQREGKDGCYHCILSYGNQWQRQNLSRARAEELFKKIVDQLDHWEDINGSVGNITSSGVIEDSELEILFVKTMENVCKKKHWNWKKEVDAVDETYNYQLIIKDDKREIKYIVLPQYKLGPSLGVEKTTVPDFQFICAYAQVKGQEVDVQNIPQWSVFMDGYDYHASKQNLRFYSDVQKREAISHSSGLPKLSWTLTWEDIKPYISPDENMDEATDELFVSSPNRKMLSIFQNDLWRIKDSVKRFVFMLSHPDLGNLRKEAFYYLASCWTDENQYAASYSHIDQAVEENARTQYADFSDKEADECHFFVKTTFIPRNTLLAGSAWYPYDCEEDYLNSVRYKWDIKEGLSEINKADWTDFWHRFNILQFFSNKAQEEPTEQINLDEVLLYFPGLENIVMELVNNKIPFDTDGGFSVMDENGQVAMEAAIKIEGKDIVIDDFSDRPEAYDYFVAHGYQVYTPETFNIVELKKN